MSEPTILVDARGTQQGFKQHRQRGLGHYAINLLERLPRQAAPTSLSYLVEPSKPIDDLIGGAGVSLTPMRTPREHSYVGQLVGYERIIPGALRRSGCRVAHFLFHLDAPLRSPIPTIVTIPDLIPYRMREAYGTVRRAKNAVQFLLERRIAAHAEAVIAISECTKRDVVELMRIDPEKVRVVYLGVDERFFQPPGEAALARVRSRYRLPGEFILYLGGIDPRKNVPALVEAWGQLQRESTTLPPLVLAGRMDNQREYPGLLLQIRRLGLEGRVLLSGYVADDDLPALLSAATVFAFPSLYEGFGLPVLQAMAAGTPVLSTRTSSIPEIAGSSVWYAGNGPPGGLAAGLQAVLKDRELAAAMAGEARVRAREFSWDRTARETVRVYENVLETLRGSSR
jgi:glycosyltransferase involved in cell wall biosynthesis